MDPLLALQVGRTIFGWLTTPKNWIYVGVVALGLVLGVMALTIRHDKQVIADDAAKVQASAGQAAVAKGDQVAASAAAAVTSQAASADAHDQEIHQENTDALQAAPGASEALDPTLNAVGRRGMCAYAAAAGDPTCVQLLQPGSGSPAPAGGVHTGPRG